MVNHKKPLTNREGDVRELTADDFAHAVPFDALPPALQQGLKSLRTRGRPKSAAPKRAVKLRIDPDVLELLRGSGKGWQSRVNALLRAAVGLQP